MHITSRRRLDVEGQARKREVRRAAAAAACEREEAKRVREEAILKAAREGAKAAREGAKAERLAATACELH